MNVRSYWQLSIEFVSFFHHLPQTFLNVMFFLFSVPKETLVKEKEKKENFQNWLSDASNNMTMNVKEDEPNQCANQ